MPRAGQLIANIGFIYLGMTLLCALAYWMAGMTGFEAVTHAMTTISTGGFSTSDQSLGSFERPAIDLVAIVFMLVGSLPFVLFLRTFKGNPGALWRDSQVRWFFGITTVAVALTAIILYVQHDFGIVRSLRLAAVNAISVLTGTGFATTDYGLWGGFSVTLFLFLIFVGGCAGSTTGGIKIFRIQVLYATAVTQVRQLLEPHGVFIAYYNGKPISEAITDSVMIFFFLYVVTFAAIATALGLIGLDFMTAISGAATAISNVGPGLGETIGPAGTFNSLPDAAKWILSLGMLLGRLELFTVLVLLAPSFWRQ